MLLFFSVAVCPILLFCVSALWHLSYVALLCHCPVTLCQVLLFRVTVLWHCVLCCCSFSDVLKPSLKCCIQIKEHDQSWCHLYGTVWFFLVTYPTFLGIYILKYHNANINTNIILNQISWIDISVFDQIQHQKDTISLMIVSPSPWANPGNRDTGVTITVGDKHKG